MLMATRRRRGTWDVVRTGWLLKNDEPTNQSGRAARTMRIVLRRQKFPCQGREAATLLVFHY